MTDKWLNEIAYSYVKNWMFAMKIIAFASRFENLCSIFFSSSRFIVVIFKRGGEGEDGR